MKAIEKLTGFSLILMFPNNETYLKLVSPEEKYICCFREETKEVIMLSFEEIQLIEGENNPL